MVIGFILLQTNLIEAMRSIRVIGWTTLIFGVLLYLSDKFNYNRNIKNHFTLKFAIIIGIFQILSLIPGVSRSGITITASRLLSFNRYDSAKISFLLSIPTLGAVSIFGINDMISKNDILFSALNLYSVIISFLFSIITIKFFLKYIQKFSLNLFVAYRVLLGCCLLFFSYS